MFHTSASLLWPQKKPKRPGQERRTALFISGCILTTKSKVLGHVPSVARLHPQSLPVLQRGGCLQSSSWESPWSSPAPKLCLGTSWGEWHLAWAKSGLETTLMAWEQFWAFFYVLTLLPLNLFEVSPKPGVIVLQSFQGHSDTIPAGKVSRHLGLPRFTLFKWKITQYLWSFQSFLLILNRAWQHKCNLKRGSLHTFHVIAWYSPAISPCVAVMGSDWFNIQY